MKSNSLDKKVDISTDQTKLRWFIDLDWYQQNNRSFFALAQSYLCPKCHERLGVSGEISATGVLSNISQCCSKSPGFITSRLPILESVFRFFLANGNQPLNLEKLGKQLSQRLDGDTCRTSPMILSRLLSSDQYYGLRQVSD